MEERVRRSLIVVIVLLRLRQSFKNAKLLFDEFFYRPEVGDESCVQLKNDAKFCEICISSDLYHAWLQW